MWLDEEEALDCTEAQRFSGGFYEIGSEQLMQAGSRPQVVTPESLRALAQPPGFRLP